MFPDYVKLVLPSDKSCFYHKVCIIVVISSQDVITYERYLCSKLNIRLVSDI